MDIMWANNVFVWLFSNTYAQSSAVSYNEIWISRR